MSSRRENTLRCSGGCEGNTFSFDIGGGGWKERKEGNNSLVIVSLSKSIVRKCVSGSVGDIFVWSVEARVVDGLLTVRLAIDDGEFKSSGHPRSGS